MIPPYTRIAYYLAMLIRAIAKQMGWLTENEPPPPKLRPGGKRGWRAWRDRKRGK